MDVTVAILTFNAEEWLEKLLAQIKKQSTQLSYEILVIDSGSNDRTVEIVKSSPTIRLHQIPNSEFGHGKTRNLAASLAKGKYILYLTQDAVPATKNWMDGMVEPFEFSDKVGCVIGRQVPHANAPATIKREVAVVFSGLGSNDGITIHRKSELRNKLGIFNTFMSNTNSAVRKDLLEKVPFRDVNYAEDQGLGIDMLEAGYYKAYAPLGAVNHSHDYGVKEYFRRKFDEYVGLQATTGVKVTAGYRELIIGTAKSTLKDWIFITRDKQYSFKQKLKNLVTSPFYNFGLRLAIRAASNPDVVSRKHHKLSMEARLRQKNK